MTKMDCRAAQDLVPGYLDGELSDAQAAPLRQHLLDCPACRGAVQETRNLKAWFVDDGEVPVPAGFAARVTRRALAGDTGAPEESLADVLVPRPAPAGGDPRRLLDFVVHLTAAAAILLLVLSLGLHRLGRPAGSELQAQDGSLGEALEELDQLNRDLEDPTAPGPEVQDPAPEDGER